MGNGQNSSGAKPKAKRTRIAPEVRAEAMRLVRSGVSNLEIANRLGIAEGSVRYMRKQADESTSLADALAVPEQPRLPKAEPSPAELEPADVGIAADASPEAALAQVDKMISDLQALAAMAKADTNHTAAGKAMRDAANLMNLRDRLRKAAQASAGDAVTIPRDLIDAKIEAIYGRVRTLASAEMCPRCGCELRMAAVGAARETKDGSK